MCSPLFRCHDQAYTFGVSPPSRRAVLLNQGQKQFNIRYTAHCRSKDLITVFLTSHLLSFTSTLFWSRNKDAIDSLSDQPGHSDLCLFALLNRHRVSSYICIASWLLQPRLFVHRGGCIFGSRRRSITTSNNIPGAATKPYSSPSSKLSTQPCPYPIANPACNLSVPG